MEPNNPRPVSFEYWTEVNWVPADTLSAAHEEETRPLFVMVPTGLLEQQTGCCRLGPTYVFETPSSRYQKISHACGQVICETPACIASS